MDRFKLLIIALALLAGGCATTTMKAQFAPGQLYNVVWQCPSTVMPCYEEILRFDRRLDDMWFIATDQLGQAWYVNLSQAIAVTPARLKSTPDGRPANVQ